MTLYVNGEKVDETLIQEEVERLLPQYQRVFTDQNPEQSERQLYEWSRENVIERVLLRQAALRDPYKVPAIVVDNAYLRMIDEYGGKRRFHQRFGLSEDSEEKVKKDIEERMRGERFIENITRTAPEPSEQDARKYYEENIEEFSAPEMVRASHIVKHFSPDADPDTLRNEMEQVLEQLRDNADFEEMATRHSDCPDDGGDLGMFPRGQMVEEFDDVVFGMKAGETSDIFRTEYGYHIAKVIEKKPADPHPFEEVSETLMEELTEQSRRSAIDEFVDREKAKATIEDK
jgi:parvulin-like peptidyl-prolyl isomerase